MNKRHYLILEAMLRNPEGLSRDELNKALQEEGFSPLNRKRFFQDMKHIRETTNLELTSTNCGKNLWKHGIRIESEEDKNRAEFAYMLIANLWESEFLSDFRQLGNRIQPLVIPHGNHYLHRIGSAMLENRVLELTYQKFTDTEPYTCAVLPYALKAYLGRWYLLARKSDEDMPKHFALDRILSLCPKEDTFVPDPTLDSTEYYKPFFGIWCDQSLTPKDILITTTSEQAHYFRTLPLHHSQKELSPLLHPDGTQECRFLLHMCITPDFEMEMQKYQGKARWEISKDEETKNLSEERL